MSAYSKLTNQKLDFLQSQKKISNYLKASNKVSGYIKPVPTMMPYSSYHEPTVEEPMNDVNSKFIVPNFQKLYQYDEANFQTEVS